jgi:glycosyltransferase involved in cell wall biosynthesis
MREWKPDVVYAHNTITNGSVARHLNAEFGTPYVITDHGFDEVIGCEHHPRRRRVFGRIARHAFRMIAIASSMAEILKRVEPAARIAVVPNGVDPVPEPMWAAPRPPEITGKTAIFSAGVFYELKGFPYLVQAFARVAGKYPDAILRIAGDGVQRGAIEQAIAEANLQDRVQLIGMKRTAEVRQEMVWADVFALLSWNDLFPTVILEAMSASCAIVCTSASGIVDVVKEGVHGHIVPPRDVDAAAAALDRLLSNPAERSRMAATGRTLVEQQLSWDAHAAKMRHIFEEAIAASTTTTTSPGDQRLEHTA